MLYLNVEKDPIWTDCNGHRFFPRKTELPERMERNHTSQVIWNSVLDIFTEKQEMEYLSPCKNLIIFKKTTFTFIVNLCNFDAVFFTVVLEDLVSWLQRIFFWVLLSDLFDRHEDPGCTAFSPSWELEQKTHLQPMLFEVPNQAKPEDPHRPCARVRSLPLSWVPQIFFNLFHLEPTHWKPPQKSHSCALPDLL